MSNSAPGHENEHRHAHAHTHGHHDHTALDWGAMADRLEFEAEVLHGFVEDTATWVAERRDAERHGATPLACIVDIGSGPGVAACALALRFPTATVLAVDQSPVVLERATARAERLGVADRVTTQQGDLTGDLGLDEPVDLIWAGMVLHHVPDQAAALARVGASLRPDGVVAIVEFGRPLECVPDSADPALVALLGRCRDAGEAWLHDEMGGSASSGAPAALVRALETAGFRGIEQRELTVALSAPLSPEARRFVVQAHERLRKLADGRLDAHDLAELDALLDPTNPAGFHQRADVFVRIGRSVTTAVWE